LYSRILSVSLEMGQCDVLGVNVLEIYGGACRFANQHVRPVTNAPLSVKAEGQDGH
jgi:hypothetical protein